MECEINQAYELTINPHQYTYLSYHFHKNDTWNLSISSATNHYTYIEFYIPNQYKTKYHTLMGANQCSVPFTVDEDSTWYFRLTPCYSEPDSITFGLFSIDHHTNQWACFNDIYLHEQMQKDSNIQIIIALSILSALIILVIIANIIISCKSKELRIQ